MPVPYNYNLNVQSPIQAAVQGLQLGASIDSIRQQRQKQIQDQMQRQRQAEILNALMSKKDATAEDYANATLALPGMKDTLKQSWEMHSEEEKKSSLTEIGEVYSALTTGNPDVAVKMLERRVEALQNSGGDKKQIDAAKTMAELIKINPDVARVQTGIRLASIPDGDKIIESVLGIQKGPDQTSMIQNLVAAGYKPGTPEFKAKMDELLSKPMSSTTVNVGKEQTEEAKVVGKAFGQQYVDIQSAAISARDSNAKLDRLNQLLEDTYTGAGGKAILSAKKTAKMLGIDTGNIEGAEAADALANEMALKLRNPAGGAGMPGALSDKDREFLVSMVPGLTTTPEGRKQMVETQKKLNERSIEVAKMARSYRQKKGSLDAGFFDELSAYSEANPLFEVSRETNRQGWRLMEDASGNRAYVSPDGTQFEEVK